MHLLQKYVYGFLFNFQISGNKKQITKVIKNIVGLFSSCSSEVVSALLDLLLMALSSSNSMEPSVDAEIGPSTETLLDEWKLPIKKISNKEPEFLAALLKEVLDVIESHENMKYETGNNQLNLCHARRFICLLLLVLFMKTSQITCCKI